MTRRSRPLPRRMTHRSGRRRTRQPFGHGCGARGCRCRCRSCLSRRGHRPPEPTAACRRRQARRAAGRRRTERQPGAAGQVDDQRVRGWPGGRRARAGWRAHRRCPPAVGTVVATGVLPMIDGRRAAMLRLSTREVPPGRGAVRQVSVAREPPTAIPAPPGEPLALATLDAAPTMPAVRWTAVGLRIDGGEAARRLGHRSASAASVTHRSPRSCWPPAARGAARSGSTARCLARQADGGAGR